MVGVPDTKVTLPLLRQDLRLMKTSADEEGAPRWLLFDGMSNKYFAISREAFVLVNQWQPEMDVEQFVATLEAKGYEYTPDDVTAFIEFLINNHLVMARSTELSTRIYQQQETRKAGFWRWLIHNYLFIRIPLFRPDSWLNQWAPRLHWLASPILQWLILLLGVLGGVLVLRQWDAFQSTFLHFFSLEGVLFYAVTLALVKSAHELGHAFVAKWHGCRVASMGVAFLVLFPVLYTDTTDAWRLPSRYKRLRIVTAGVRVEICLALLATFFWNFLPDGPLRSAAFFVATTSWVTSLLINISPFLRFDGYYAFSDWLGIENLQSRSFALGRWSLRKILFGLEDPLPEPLPRSRCRTMIIYAWCTWVYRFFLFLGIALVVYHLFFKLLGIVLFVVEILWFILIPMMKETKVWLLRRRDFKATPVRVFTLLILGGLMVWAVLPLPARIHLPAVLKANQYTEHFSPIPARIEERLVNVGDRVESGQVLLKLSSDELDYQQLRLEEELRLVNLRMLRNASSLIEKSSRAILEQQAEQIGKQLAGITARQTQLDIRATHAGVVSEISLSSLGSWVGIREVLVSVVDYSSYEMEAYLSETDLEWVGFDQTGVFISNRGEREPIPVTLTGIDMAALSRVNYEEMASLYGGSIAVRKTRNDQLIPEQSFYSVRLSIHQEAASGSIQRIPGVVVLDAKPRSLMWFNIQRVLALMIRESGF